MYYHRAYRERRFCYGKTSIFILCIRTHLIRGEVVVLANLRGEESEDSESLFLAGLLLGSSWRQRAVESLAGVGQNLELPHPHVVLGSLHLHSHH